MEKVRLGDVRVRRHGPAAKNVVQGTPQKAIQTTVQTGCLESSPDRERAMTAVQISRMFTENAERLFLGEPR
jgi:hypothetical protein